MSDVAHTPRLGSTTALWLGFAARTATSFAGGLVILVVGSFLLVHAIGGDPVRNAAGLDVSEAQIQAMRQSLHLDDPLPTQFVRFAEGLLRLDLGESFVSQQPVIDTLRVRIGNSLRLAVVAMMFVALASVSIGTVVGGLTQSGSGRRTHLGFAGVTGVLIAIPEFLVATLLVYLFAVRWQVFPVAGKAGASSYVLPAAALAIAPTALLARIVRIETVKVLGSDYMRTARSKHLPLRRLYLRHVLPNSLTSAVAIGGLVFISMVGGVVVIENVFSWPGIGTTLVSSILARDYPMVQGIILLLGLLVLVVNTVVDVVLAILNPKTLAGKT